MKKVRFVEDAKLDPGRYYRNPIDIIRDRRLNKEERLQIVIAWELATREQMASAATPLGAEEKLLQLQRLRVELEHEIEGAGTAPKPS